MPSGRERAHTEGNFSQGVSNFRNMIFLLHIVKSYKHNFSLQKGVRVAESTIEHGERGRFFTRFKDGHNWA